MELEQLEIVMFLIAAGWPRWAKHQIASWMLNGHQERRAWRMLSKHFQENATEAAHVCTDFLQAPWIPLLVQLHQKPMPTIPQALRADEKEHQKVAANRRLRRLRTPSHKK